jgi:hypothetical protein
VTPIVHPIGQRYTSVWQRLPGADNTWVHGTATGVLLKASHDRVFPATLVSESLLDQIPPSGKHVDPVTIPASAILINEGQEPVHVPWSEQILPGADIHAVESIPLTNILVPTSVYVVGNPVMGDHFGLGIDHIPEPVSLVLLGMGGLALLLQAWIRRRRRTA